jgi:flagellar hook-associated protein 1 FlgK
MVVYTDSGVTLFETTARSVTFDQTNTYDATTTGNAGLCRWCPGRRTECAVMPISSGRLHGPDDPSRRRRGNLPEPAGRNRPRPGRGLCRKRPERWRRDRTRPGCSPGFGGPAVPAAATLVVGLAADIRINANADPDQGRRTGPAAGRRHFRSARSELRLQPARSRRLQRTACRSTWTPWMRPGFRQRRRARSDRYPDRFASSSVSWLESQRQTATSDLEVQSVIVSPNGRKPLQHHRRQHRRGDDPLLDIERAYAAAAPN